MIASDIKLFGLLQVLNVLWFSVADTLMRRSCAKACSSSHSNWCHTLRHT